MCKPVVFLDELPKIWDASRNFFVLHFNLAQIQILNCVVFLKSTEEASNLIVVNWIPANIKFSYHVISA